MSHSLEALGGSNPTHLCCRSGGTTGVCARYVKAALPPLDRAGQASVGLAVLAIGIVMTVVGVIFVIIAVVVIARQRREIRRYRCPALICCLNLWSRPAPVVTSQAGMPLPCVVGRVPA